MKILQRLNTLAWITSAVLALGGGSVVFAQDKAKQSPIADSRAGEPRHLNQTYVFPTFKTKADWETRATDLRLHILASAGLLPPPPSVPLRPQIFGKVDQGDYTVEKVYFETLLGIFVTGNLFRPKNLSGKLPGILNAHGHDRWGRLENSDLFGPVKRAASFAKLGMVSFSYDMIGYGDNLAIPHEAAIGDPKTDLWGLSLLGVQLANSLKAVDFLLSLPDVDSERIGMTGESGGGTQTFLTAAVDDRIKAAVPVNMISSIMQGGCACENAPNLRIDSFNVELAALIAPRPMLMVSATGDWTKNTPQVEFPAIRSIYTLYGANSRLSNVHMTAPHNYNLSSREAAYGFFAQQFLKRGTGGRLDEPLRNVPPPSDLLVFYGIPRPKNEANAQQLKDNWIAMSRQQLVRERPRNAETLATFQSRFGVALRQAIGATSPAASVVEASSATTATVGDNTVARYFLSREHQGDKIPVALWRPAKPDPAKTTVLVAKVGTEPEGPLVDALMKTGHTVLVVSVFAGSEGPPTKTVKYKTTYNRTDAANRVQDILSSLAHLRAQQTTGKVAIVGMGKAGLSAFLARAYAPALTAIAADVGGFANNSDDAFIKELPIPGIRRAGDFLTAALAETQSPLLVHGTGTAFQTKEIMTAYREIGRSDTFKTMAGPASIDTLTTWLDK